MNRLRLLFSSYLLVIVALFFYSFTQVDLNLTLSQASIYQTLEKQFQYIGFFQRPISALTFFVIALLLFIFYFSFLYLAKKEKITFKTVKVLIFLTFIFLVFSYNAFSYDLFNYIFDAKILTFYNQNPYFHKPTDFVDPMLNFMRWTHRVYPYGPSWLILTAPLSFIGSNLFLPTFFLFKLLIGLFFVGSSFLVYKISEILFPKEKIFNTIFWAFNPLVIIEGLVSAHNDFPLVFFGLLSIYLYLKNQKLYSIISLAFSIGVKYLTFLFIPVFVLIFFMDKTNKKINWEYIFLLLVIFSIASLIAVSFRTTFQPWYLIFPLSLCSFLSRKLYIFIPAVLASIFSLLIYVIYVFMTDYAKGYPQIISNVEYIGLFSISIFLIAYFLKTKLNSYH